MVDVISGFAVIWIIIALGIVLGRAGTFGEDAEPVLQRVVFYVATPCMLFSTIAQADIHQLVAAPLYVQVISAAVTLVLFVVIARPWLRLRGGELLIGGMSASYVKGKNLGLPIAAFVLHDASHAAPVLLFQLGIYTPLLMIGFDLLGGHGHGLMPVVRRASENPLLIGSLAGLAVSASGWTPPAVLMNSIDLLGGMSVPGMLLTFGLSLADHRPFQNRTSTRQIVLATVIKLVVQPLVAYLIGSRLFGLEGDALFAVVVMASLPTAQNAFNYAAQYRLSPERIRDTVLTTTLLAVPALMIVAWLLHS